MKLLFILGSCENGKDGVADYTIKLANQLISKNIETRILSVNDSFMAENNNREEIHSNGLTVYRLAASKSWATRQQDAYTYVSDFNPNWLSWQYVPFSYQSKGLPVSVNNLINKIRKDHDLHIMFHELWIDTSFPLPWKQRFLGALQKKLIRKTIAATSPEIITTSNSFYAELLQREKIRTHILPLHSNITNQKASIDAVKLIFKNTTHFDFGFFGNILPTMCKSMFRQLLLDHKDTNKNLRVFSAGRLSQSSKDIFNDLQKDYSCLADFICLGELKEEEISQYIRNLDICLTSYPIELAGKSGAVATFRFYEKPVASIGKLKTTSLFQNYTYLSTELDTPCPAQTATRFINLLYTAKKYALSLSAEN